MKREERFDLINELSKAVTEKTVYEHANLMNGSKQTEKIADTEEEIFAKIYEQRKTKQ